jgi:mycoredoxin
MLASMVIRPLPRLSIARFLVSIAVVAMLVFTWSVGGHAASQSGFPERAAISSSQTAVTVYGATWCSACRSLEAKLDQRRIPFSVIDVDKNREAYDRARNASGMGPGIPLTHVTQNVSTWVQGDDADAIERAYKGD